jgi:hypothetical protein
MAISRRKELSDAVDEFLAARHRNSDAINRAFVGDDEDFEGDEDDDEIEDALLEGPIEGLLAATAKFNLTLNGKVIRFRRDGQEWVAVPGTNGSVDVHPIDEHVW